MRSQVSRMLTSFIKVCLGNRDGTDPSSALPYRIQGRNWIKVRIGFKVVAGINDSIFSSKRVLFIGMDPDPDPSTIKQK
jgi:hypothetical protein